MKKTIITLTTIAIITTITHAQASLLIVLDQDMGTLSDGTTYTITGNNGFNNDGSIRTTQNNSGQVIIEFSSAVDLFIGNTLDLNGSLFNNSGVIDTFTAVGGTFTYQSGDFDITNSLTFSDNDSVVTTSFFNAIGGTQFNDTIGSDQDFGTLTAAGITELTFDYTEGFESFIFSVTDTIPEPSSTALFGLGSLTLLARRRR